MVRLVDGSTVSEGRVEIYCNNEWGTVCDTREIDSSGFANLACKQLGYTNAGTWDEIIRLAKLMFFCTIMHVFHIILYIP